MVKGLGGARRGGGSGGGEVVVVGTVRLKQRYTSRVNERKN